MTLALILVPFLEATVRTATPLLLAALGELVTERAGVINLGLEGAVIAGCLAALLGAAGGGVGGGFLAAGLAGAAVAAIVALFVLRLDADQVIAGTAVTLLAMGATGTIHRALFDTATAAQALPTAGPVAIPLLSRIPLLGPAFFHQPLVTYALYLAVPALAWWMRRTHAGLALRATGERREAAAAAGVRTLRIRMLAILFGGMMGGLAGGALVLVQVGTFNEGMSAGRGFIAIAIVVLGRWSVVGTALASLAFGASFALQYLFQTAGSDVPYPLFLAFPYALTLLLLALQRGRAAAPAGLAKS
jgi:simple sugar transport system permease protein